MEKLLVIPIMALFARMCGASWTPKWFPAEGAWAVAIAITVSSTVYQFIVITIFSYVAMQLGHGRVYGMNGANLTDPKPEAIEAIVQKLYTGDITKPIYSWLCIGLKGFLIGLPLGILAGCLNALWWPFSYWLGMKKLGDGAYAEIAAGAGVGILVWLSV